jgi:hypothetical protein
MSTTEEEDNTGAAGFEMFGSELRGTAMNAPENGSADRLCEVPAGMMKIGAGWPNKGRLKCDDGELETRADLESDDRASREETEAEVERPRFLWGVGLGAGDGIGGETTGTDVPPSSDSASPAA